MSAPDESVLDVTLDLLEDDESPPAPSVASARPLPPRPKVTLTGAAPLTTPSPRAVAVASGSPPPIPVRSASGGPVRTDSQSRIAAASVAEAPPAIGSSRDGGFDEDALVILDEKLAERVAPLALADDKVGLARVHVERAILAELAGEDAKAIAQLERAIAAQPDFAMPRGILRRKIHSRARLGPMLAHLEREIALAGSDVAEASLLAERARLLTASGEARPQLRKAWESVLLRLPNHPAALSGLEGELEALWLENPASGAEALAAHLGRMAEASLADRELAAWLHVERARLLASLVNQRAEAIAAFERALQLDPRVGPIRAAYQRFAAETDDAVTLVRLLAEGAEREADPIAAAVAEYDAATIAQAKNLGDGLAIALLESAVRRFVGDDGTLAFDAEELGPSGMLLRSLVLERLLTLYERDGRRTEAIHVRQARLALATEPAVLSFEHATLSALREAAGDRDGAVDEMLAAHTLAPEDIVLFEESDRLLAAADRHFERIALAEREFDRRAASGHGAPEERALLLVEAARIAEALGYAEGARRLLGLALEAAPTDNEVLAAVALRRAPAPSDDALGPTRDVIDLFEAAAKAETDDARAVAHLERVAVLWENVIVDPVRAADAYGRILAREPGRRSAIFGWQRTAALAKKPATVAEALLAEADATRDDAESRLLRVRAAEILAPLDDSRALTLLNEVLVKDPRHERALIAVTRIHATAGRAKPLALALEARIAAARPGPERLRAYLHLARLRGRELGAREEAIAALHAALHEDPDHPATLAELLRMEDDPTRREKELGAFAARGRTPLDRARWLLEAAELRELALADDAGAERHLRKALAELPGAPLVLKRLERVLARRAFRDQGREGQKRPETTRAGRERMAVLAEIAESSRFTPADRRSADLGLAEARFAARVDEDTAVGRLESQGDGLAARLLVRHFRTISAFPKLARAYGLFAERTADAIAKRGALWAKAALEAWKIPSNSGPSTATYQEILAVDPTDLGALEAVLRLAFPAARDGDDAARFAVITALRSFTAAELRDRTGNAAHIDRSVVLAGEMQLATALERWTPSPSTKMKREIVERFARALDADRRSLSAAKGLARAARRFGDRPREILATEALAELATTSTEASELYLQAAQISLAIAATASAGADAGPERGLARGAARGFLEKAFARHPDAHAAAELYLTLSEEDGEIRQLVDQFRELFDRATQPETRVFVGFAAARHARDSLQNTTTARALVEKVLALAPESDVALLLLAELLVEARAWPEATERLEAVARLTTDSERKLRALVGLARIYETVLPAPDERERILRALIVVEPREPKHANALAAHLIARASTAEAPLAVALRREASQLLESVVPLAADMTGRARALVAVAKGRELLGELDAADAALGQALALSPDPERFVAGLESGVRDARRLANVLGAANRFDGAEGREPPPERLQRLGILLLARCGDAAAAIAPLRASLTSRTGAGTADARAALVEACARVQAPEQAVDAGLPLVYPTPDGLLALADAETPLRTLSQALVAVGRSDEARPLREVLGDELSLPRTPAERPAEAPLPRAALHGLVPSQEPLLAVILAMQGLETKLLRGDLAEVGVAPREKISARIGHPLRTAMERLLRPFGAPPFEMVVSDVLTAPRVIQQDEPWVLLPSRLSSDRDPATLVTLARAAARIALGYPWLFELPAARIEALLVAVGRSVAPSFARGRVDGISERFVAEYEAPIAKAMPRKVRKQLEETLAGVSAGEAAAPVDAAAFVDALVDGELRLAWSLVGGLPAFTAGTSAAARLADPRFHALVRFAATREGAAWARRLGGLD